MSLSVVAIDSAGKVAAVLPLDRNVNRTLLQFWADSWREFGYRVAPLPFVPRPGVLVSEPVDAEVAG